MNTYGFSKRYFITIVSYSLLSLMIFFMMRTIFFKILLGGLLLMFMYDLVDKVNRKYILDEKGLVIKSLFKKRVHLEWGNVNKIEKMSERKNSYIIVADRTIFIISTNISDYLTMLDEVIKICSGNKDITINID